MSREKKFDWPAKIVSGVFIFIFIDMSRNDMEDKLDTVIKRVSKRGTIKYKWIVECHLDSRDIVCVLY